MTMKWLTILQFMEIVAAYGIVTLFLPWLVLRPLPDHRARLRPAGAE